MVNEGLKFAALVLGIALVIVIIILIAGGHKDKYHNTTTTPETTGDGACCGMPGYPADPQGQCYDANPGEGIVTSEAECKKVGLDPWGGTSGPLCGSLNKWDTHRQVCPGAPAGAKKQGGVCWGPQGGAAAPWRPPFCFDKTTTPAITTKKECENAEQLLRCGVWKPGRLCDQGDPASGGEPPCLDW